MLCSKCQRDAIVFQPYSGLHLCGQHLIADVEAKAKKMIRTQGWLMPGDHIAVLLSRDQGSSALLYFLKHLTARRRDIRISALAINESMEEQNDTSHAKRIAHLLDTECFTASLNEKSRSVTDAVLQKTKEASDFHENHLHRSILLEKIAERHGITKIAQSISLDDVAGAVLESIIRGEVERLGGTSCPETIPHICPFISVTTAEVSVYATLCGFGDEQAICQDHENGLHMDTVAMLDIFTKNHPATKYALRNLGEIIAGSLTGIAGLIHAAEVYRQYPREVCSTGSIQDEVIHGAS